MKAHSTAWRRLQPGPARKYIRKFNIKSGDLVWLVCRVSEHVQRRNKNDDGQATFLRKEVKQRGGVVVGVTKITISGFHPYWLAKAAALAKQHGAILLAETTDRYVRHPFYHSAAWPSAQARHTDLDVLAYYADGADLMTFLDPEATPREVRSQQSKRGQWAKDNKGGRPAKENTNPTSHPGCLKQRRVDNYEIVRQLKQDGVSVPEIMKTTGVKRDAVYRWLRGWCSPH